KNADDVMSEWIEILISKEDCSYIVAEQILNLTLTGLVNETTGEEGIIYLYDANSTHAAALMNLPYDVLKIIPMPSPYKNSPTGSSPRIAERLVKPKLGEFKKNFKWWDITDWAETFSDWWDDLVDWFNSLVEDFLKLLSDLVAFVLETIAAAAEAIAETAKKVAEAGLKLIEAVVRAAMAVLEMMLKATLLVKIYLELNKFLILLNSLFFLLNYYNQISDEHLLEIHRFIIEINLSPFTFQLGLNIFWNYDQFLNINLPFLNLILKLNNIPFLSYISGILSFREIQKFWVIILEELPNKLYNNTEIINAGLIGYRIGELFCVLSLQILYNIIVEPINYPKYLSISLGLVLFSTFTEIFLLKFFEVDLFNIIMFGMSIAYFFSSITLIILMISTIKMRYEDFIEDKIDIKNIIYRLIYFFLFQIGIYIAYQFIKEKFKIEVSDAILFLFSILFTIISSIMSEIYTYFYICMALILTSYVSSKLYGYNKLRLSIIVLIITYSLLGLLTFNIGYLW
ncbi:MAG: hypothetical protein ACTSQP_23810, partial [Promethearchaeota archaeon]